MTITTISAGPIVADTPVTACAVDAAPAGVSSTYVDNGGNSFTATMSDGSEGDLCYYRFDAENQDSTNSLWVGKGDFAAIEPDVIVTQFHCGTEIIAGGTLSGLEVKFELGPDSSPSSTLGPVDVDIPFELVDTSGSC